MHRFFVSPEQITDGQIVISGPDYNHIHHVLRMKTGEEANICTGEDDREYRCCLSSYEEGTAVWQIMWEQQSDAELSCRLYLFQGLPKSDKMEWIIQKAVELGACEIIPVAMHRSVVKLSGGKAQTKEKRWNAIAQSAAKQAKRMIIPKVAPVMNMKEAAAYAADLDVILLPYELAEGMEYTRQVLSSILPGQSVGIFIGPEGGFEPEEVALLKERNAKVISLGRRILRTETAGMALLAALMLQLEGRDAPAT